MLVFKSMSSPRINTVSNPKSNWQNMKVTENRLSIPQSDVKNETGRVVKSKNWRCCTIVWPVELGIVVIFNSVHSPKGNQSIIINTEVNTKFNWKNHKPTRWPLIIHKLKKKILMWIRLDKSQDNNDWPVKTRAQLLDFTQTVGIVTVFLSLALVGLPRLRSVLPSPSLLWFRSTHLL